MNKSVSWLTLDLNRRDVQGSVSFGQGETGRRLCIRLVENGKPYEIGRGCFAVMSGTLPDGSTFFNECVISDNVIVYDVTPKNASQVGVAECEVQIYGYDGGLLRSPRLHMVIHKGRFNVEDVEGSQEFTALSKLFADFKEMVGTEALKTEAQTLRGAINEVHGYVLTDEDMQEIADLVFEKLPSEEDISV